MANLQLEIENDDRLMSQLRQMEQRVQGPIVNKATTAAGKVVYTATKSEFRQIKQTGYTLRSLRLVKRSRKGTTTVRIGQKKQAKYKPRKSTRVHGRNLSQIQRAGKPTPIHWIERGTKPHEVHAKPGKRLVFRIGKKTIFAKKVNNPGSRARYPLGRSLRHSRPAASKAFNRTVSIGIKQAASAI